VRKLLLGCAAACAAASAFAQAVSYEAVGDAIPKPLSAEPGDAARGRSIMVNRDQGGCTLCHEVPGETRFGNIAPPLAGVGADSTRVNPDTPMPAYYRTEGLTQVAAAYRGKPVLSARQVEDVVAYLATLKGPK
jgi:sulfur-oxidizing protein SoxX